MSMEVFLEHRARLSDLQKKPRVGKPGRRRARQGRGRRCRARVSMETKEGGLVMKRHGGEAGRDGRHCPSGPSSATPPSTASRTSPATSVARSFTCRLILEAKYAFLELAVARADARGRGRR